MSEINAGPEDAALRFYHIFIETQFSKNLLQYQLAAYGNNPPDLVRIIN